jgi:hypothetical protein
VRHGELKKEIQRIHSIKHERRAYREQDFGGKVLGGTSRGLNESLSDDVGQSLQALHDLRAREMAEVIIFVF